MNGSARPPFYLVDGHSVIHAWPDLLHLHARRPRQARDELIRRLTAFQDAQAARIVLVFDGRGSRLAAEASEPAGIQVVYSGRGASADSVIEKLVATHAATHDLTVVTADQAERAAVTALGAWWCHPDEFLRRTGSALGETRRALDRTKPARGFRLGEAAGW